MIYSFNEEITGRRIYDNYAAQVTKMFMYGIANFLFIIIGMFISNNFLSATFSGYISISN